MFRRSMKCAVAVAGLASLVAATSASAAGEKFLFRVAAAQVNPNDNSTDVVPFGGGAQVAVGNATGLALNVTYLFTPNMGVEVLGSLPFTHDIEGAGTIAGAGKIGETKQLPPTVLFVLRGNDSSGIHPYVGLGVNYTLFFSEDTEGALAGTSLELDDSIGQRVHPVRILGVLDVVEMLRQRHVPQQRRPRRPPSPVLHRQVRVRVHRLPHPCPESL